MSMTACYTSTKSSCQDIVNHFAYRMIIPKNNDNQEPVNGLKQNFQVPMTKESCHFARLITGQLIRTSRQALDIIHIYNKLCGSNLLDEYHQFFNNYKKPRSKKKKNVASPPVMHVGRHGQWTSIYFSKLILTWHYQEIK